MDDPHRGSGERPGSAGDGVLPHRQRVVVKFHDGVGLPYHAFAAHEVGRMVDPLGNLAAYLPDLSFEPLLGAKPPDTITDLVARARALDPTYDPPDFLSYFAVPVPEGTDARELADVLAGLPAVAFAYVEPPPGAPPSVRPDDDEHSPRQGYLDPAPVGIDARYAWTQAGGDGAGQGLVDLEMGWTLDHEDLAAHKARLISGENRMYFFHGTAILGIVAAVDNDKGCVGIVPNVRSVRCVSQWRAGGSFSTPEPILDSIAVMAAGDVLLLEAETRYHAGYEQVPVEIEPAVCDIVKLATTLQIVVVEAAGNGGQNLDTVTLPGRGRVFDRKSANFRDSGAVVVGSAGSETHVKMRRTCFGNRVDCYAWGENVTTAYTDSTGTARDMYYHHAGATSAAAAIVAGAALAVQGVSQARFGRRMNPRELRALLSDPANNTRSGHPDVDRIGVMPDLRNIIDRLT